MDQTKFLEENTFTISQVGDQCNWDDLQEEQKRELFTKITLSVFYPFKTKSVEYFLMYTLAFNLLQWSQ